MSEFDWKAVVSGAVGGVLASSAIGAIYWFIEQQKRILCTVTGLHLGPTLGNNGFLATHCPSENQVSLNGQVRFFSNKSLQTGLQKIRVEFCRTTALSHIVEFTADNNSIFIDMSNTVPPYQANTLSLPPREFVKYDIKVQIGRDFWPQVRHCTFVRLSCETPEGRKKRFPLGKIAFPEMPSEGTDGTNYMRVECVPPARGKRQIVIRATRVLKEMAAHLKPGPEDTRYWSGGQWVRDVNNAKLYKHGNEAKADGAPIKIWNNVPQEWLEESESHDTTSEQGS